MDEALRMRGSHVHTVADLSVGVDDAIRLVGRQILKRRLILLTHGGARGWVVQARGSKRRRQRVRCCVQRRRCVGEASVSRCCFGGWRLRGELIAMDERRQQIRVHR